MVTLINLAPVELTVTFDGQTMRLAPGENIVPKLVVPYAKNQNPVMGTQDADNPNISGALYLVGVKGSKKDRQEPLSKDEWAAHCGSPSRIDTQAFFADRLGPKERVITRGKGKTQARSSFDAGVRMPGSSDITLSE
jgi:hypothetical protein